MQVLVDTSVWSHALRRPEHRLSDTEGRLVTGLREVIQDGRARLIGSIRQELLSGVHDPAQFEALREKLRPFPDEPLTAEDYEEAARWSNECRRSGVAGSGIDFLICAAAVLRHWQIFTTDTDFRAYSKVIPIQLV